MENYNTRHYLMFPSSMNSSFKPSSWELDVWPPRSYTCSFCNRVFRSAQALGGHMNIHKRERARLKQHSSDHKSSADSKLDDPSRSFSHQNEQLKNCKEYYRYSYPIVRGMKNNNGHDMINESVKRSREITALHQHHHHHHDNNGLDEFIMPTTKFINLVDNVTIMSKRHKSERLIRSIDQSFSTCSHEDDIDLELRLG